MLSDAGRRQLQEATERRLREQQEYRQHAATMRQVAAESGCEHIGDVLAEWWRLRGPTLQPPDAETEDSD